MLLNESTMVSRSGSAGSSRRVLMSPAAMELAAELMLVSGARTLVLAYTPNKALDIVVPNDATNSVNNNDLRLSLSSDSVTTSK